MNHNESVAWGGVGDDQDPLLQTKHYSSFHGMESILVYDTEWIGSYPIVQPN